MPVNAFKNNGIPILTCNVQRNPPLCFSVCLVPLQRSTELTVYNCEDHFHIHIFIGSSNIWLSYVPAVYSPLHGFIWDRHSDRLPVGLLAQLVEHCTIIAEVMGSNPVQAWIFFRPSFTYGLSSVHNCEDHSHIHFSLTVKPGQPFQLDCPGCEFEPIRLVIHCFSIEASKLLWQCELLRPVKLNYAACALDPIKLSLHFVQLKPLS